MNNLDRARLEASIADRAQRITEDYRLVWNRFDKVFEVAHKKGTAISATS